MQSFKITIDNRDFVVICLPNRPKALLDRTVAEIYEIETMHINQAVRRNPEKFPEDFCFELTLDETRTLIDITNCDIDWKGGHLPKAFTHLGCNMLATVLKSPRAVQRAIQIIRTFTALESGGYDRVIRELGVKSGAFLMMLTGLINQTPTRQDQSVMRFVGARFIEPG